jgi:hypothetical protein
VVASAGCNDDDEAEKSVAVPFSIDGPLQEAIGGMALGRTEQADFNGDGNLDPIVTYGPASATGTAQIHLVVEVEDEVTTFQEEGRELSFSVTEVNGDGVDDLVVRWIGSSPLAKAFTWNSGHWIEYCQFESPPEVEC